MSLRRRAAVFLSRHVVAYYACIALVLVVVCAYLHNYAGRQFPTRIPGGADAGRNAKELTLEGAAARYCQKALGAMLEHPNQARHPSPDSADVVDVGLGFYRVKSYVDDVSDKGACARVDYVCTLSFEEGRFAMKSVSLKR